MNCSVLAREALKARRARENAKRETQSLITHIVAWLDGGGQAKELAEKAGVSPQFISDVRNGRRSIGDEVIVRLSEL